MCRVHGMDDDEDEEDEDDEERAMRSEVTVVALASVRLGPRVGRSRLVRWWRR